MKKIFYIITAMFMALLSSCQKEEVADAMKDNNDRVCISAEIPANIAATRAQINIPTTHQLRCIMEVWTKSATPALKYREEMAVPAGSSPAFDFELEPGDYTCLMWADLIEANAETTEVTTDEVVYTHFADNFYNTADLRAVTIKDGEAATLFDTDLCDGFFAKQELLKGQASVTKTTKLIRPFAKLIVKEKDAAKFGELKKMSVSYQLPEGFNVATGEPLAGKIMATYQKEFKEGDVSQRLFTNYAFTPSTGGLALPAIALSFTTKGKIDCDISEGSIQLKRNQQTNASGNLIVGEGVEPDPDPSPEDKELNVGDYYFIDGTWSAELTEANKANCVGIVFATGSHTGDNLADYGGGATGKKILGYVMALNTIYGEASDGLVQNESGFSGRIYWYNAKPDVYETLMKTFPYTKPLDVDNFNGYAKTESYLTSTAFKAHSADLYFPALQIFNTWRGKQKAVANASSWYIPSFKQLSSVVGGCYGYAAVNSYFEFPAVDKVIALSTAFETAQSMKIAQKLTTANHFLFTSTISMKQPGEEPLVIVCNNTSAGIKPQQTNKPAGVIRPVFTILK